MPLFVRVAPPSLLVVVAASGRCCPGFRRLAGVFGCCCCWRSMAGSCALDWPEEKMDSVTVVVSLCRIECLMSRECLRARIDDRVP